MTVQWHHVGQHVSSAYAMIDPDQEPLLLQLDHPVLTSQAA